MFLAEFITIAIIALLAAMSPGPDFVMVTRNSLAYSRRAGIYTALGVSFGILVHVTYSIVGIGFLIAQSIILFNIIKYVGAGYLVYIGIKSLRAKHCDGVNIQAIKEKRNVTVFKAVGMGFLTNALNPKASLFFLSIFTQVISSTTPLFVQVFYGLEVMFIVLIWFVSLAVVLSHAGIKGKIIKIQHYFEKAAGAILIALGIRIAISSSD